MKKLKALVTIGAPASGKSTYVKSLNLPETTLILERDNFRKDECRNRFNYVDDGTNFHKYYHLLGRNITDQIENYITAIFDYHIENKKNDLVFSNTNINKKHRNKLIRKLEENGYEVTIKYFNLPLDVLLENNKQRIDVVDTHVIINMYQSLQRQLTQIHHDSYMKHGQLYNNCIIVDIDGTIAHIENKYRSHYDTNCGSDLFDDLVFNMAFGLSKEYEADIIFLTGRTSKSWQSTRQWLDKHIGEYTKYNLELNNGYQLYCRHHGDYRKDAIIKRELYDTFISNRYSDVLCVFDDRPSVIDMWHDLGLKVITVSDYRNKF